MKESYGGTGVSRKARLASTHPPTAQAAIKNIPTETDRGSGNKAKRRAGMPVEKKSPTYKAYTANKKTGNMSESHYGKSVNKIPKELDKAVSLHKSQAKRLRNSNEVKKDAGKAANAIPAQLDKAVAMHSKQAKTLRKAGISEAKDKKGKGSGTKDACYHKVKSRYSVWPSAYASGALVKCRKVGAANWGNKSESVEMKNYLDKKAKKLDKQRSAQPDRYKNNPAFDSTSPDSKDPAVARSRAKYEEYNLEEAKKKKKAQKCWPGYEKKGTKMMFGKRYNNCVKKEEYSDWRDEIEYVDEAASKAITLGIKGAVAGGKAIGKKLSRKAVRAGIKVGGKQGGKAVKKAGKVAATETKKAAAETAGAVGAGAAKGLKKRKEKFVAKVKRKSEEIASGEGKKKPQNVDENVVKDITTFPQRMQAGITQGGENFRRSMQSGITQGGENFRRSMVKGAGTAAAIGAGAYVGSKLIGKGIDRVLPDKKKSKVKTPGEKKTVKEAKSPAWQRKAGKSESGGLNAKGVASYRAANPGSKLKTAVTTKPSKLKKGSKAAERRLSFCRRMKGMKKKLTSAKTARDPDSRINKSLRKWNC